MKLINIFSRSKPANKIPPFDSDEQKAAVVKALAIGEPKTNLVATPAQQLGEMPTVAGRSSEIPTSDLFSNIIAEAAIVDPEFELSLLKVCNHLAKFNGDVSYGVDNVVQLGNTPSTISFDDTVEADLSREMIKYLKNAELTIYSGGMNSLSNDLFAQVAVNGALSAEAIPDRTLSFVQQVAIVPVDTIRFKYSRDSYTYEPYQTLTNGAVPTHNFSLGSVKKLNTLTYKYYALRRLNDNPYGIPPFISALEMVEVEKDMICSMKHIIAKIGLFGFLTAMLNPPLKKQGETEDQFFTRSQEYLNKVRPTIEAGYASGISLGFKGSIEYKVEANNTNVEGFKDIMELVTVMKMAGMKQDPLMLGRNMNVAETMARVIMTKLVSQIANYQRLVASFREDIYRMMLNLGGYAGKFRRITVEYSAPTVGDKLREEQTYEKRIDNYEKLRNIGIIDQQELAQSLDYEKPHAERDVDYTVRHIEDKPFEDPNTDPKVDPNQSEDATGSGATDYSGAKLRLTMGRPEFTYTAGSCTHSFAAAREEIADLVSDYYVDVKKDYDKAVKKVVSLIMTSFENRTPSTLQEVQDRVLYILYNNWDEQFIQPTSGKIKKWVRKAYNEFTKADDKRTKDLYLLLSLQALNYFETSDQFFIGQFISDADTKNRIFKYLDERFSQPFNDIFSLGLEEALNSESWKIERILTTTVTKLDNITELIRLAASGAEKFILVSVKDSRRCNYCAAMEGKIFSIPVAMEKLKKFVEGGPQTINTDAPFITQLFKGKEGVIQLSSMTGEELQAAGFDGLLSHPNCRCRLVKT